MRVDDRSEPSAFAARFKPAPGLQGWLILQRDGTQLIRVDPPSDWLKSRLAARVQPNSLRSEARSLSIWWRWCIDTGVDPLMASANDFSDFLLVLQTTPKDWPLIGAIRVLPGDPRARKDSSIRQYVNHVKAFYLWADLQGDIVSTVTGQQLSRFKSPRVSQPKTAPRLFEEEVTALLARPFHPRDRLGIEFLYGCGLRIGEALGIRIQDLHDSQDIASLYSCRVPWCGPHVHVVRRMNPNGAIAKSPYERIVALPSSVMRAYNDWCAWLYENLPDDECGFLLLSLKGPTRGRPWSVSAFRDMWDRRIKSLPGLAGSHPHILRHTFASELNDAGVAPFTIQEILGHRRPESTQIYTHAHAKTMHDAVQRLCDYRAQMMTAVSA